MAKKRRTVKIEEHREVTLLSTAYKVYASVFANRLRKEIEEKELVPKNQTSVQKRKEMIDNIYCVNYLVGREVRRGEKIVAAVVDLKTAFDLVDRKSLGKRLKEQRIEKEGYGDI